MNKYDFIQQLLENKKITPAQRERVFLLTKEEFKKDGIRGKELEDRVKKLEEKAKIETIVVNKEEITDEEINSYIPKQYFNPSDLYSFLKDYNDDMILKSTCHLIDRGEIETINNFCQKDTYDFNAHYNKIIEHYENLKNKYRKKFVDNKFKALIETYLAGGGNWNNTISINWKSLKLIEWTNMFQGIPPSLDPSLFDEFNSIGFEIDEFKPMLKLLDNENVQTFGDLVQYFKYLFHIRSDNSISKLCKKINENYIDEVDFDYTEVREETELFTNVEKLLETYKTIIQLIKEVSMKNNLEKPQIKLSFYSNEDNTIVFSILHKNSIYKHTIEDALQRPGATYKNLVSNQLNGLCDFYVNADFGNNQYARIIIWDFKVWKTRKHYQEATSKVNGVEYVLKFKR